MRNRELNEQERFTLEGVYQLYENKIGFLETMKLAPIIYLHHVISRGICKETTEDMKRFLLREGMETTEIMNTIKRFSKYKNDLVKYDVRIQNRMDKVSQMYEPKTIASWELVDNRQLGVVKDDEGYRVVDVSNGTEKLLARINEGVYWFSSNLTPNQMSYIKEYGKVLSQPKKGVLV